MADKATSGTPTTRGEGKGGNRDGRKPAEKRARASCGQSVIVTCIPPTMTDSDLQCHFKRVCANTRLYRPRSDPTLCYAEFEASEQVKEALALAPPEKDGQQAKVRELTRMKVDPLQKILLKRVPTSMNNNDVKEHYSGLGDDAVLRVSRMTRYMMCFITFKSKELAQQALSIAPPAKDGVQTIVEPVDVQKASLRTDDQLKLISVTGAIRQSLIRQHYDALLGTGAVSRCYRSGCSFWFVRFSSPELLKASFKFPTPMKDDHITLATLRSDNKTSRTPAEFALYLAGVPPSMSHLDILQHYASLGPDAVACYRRPSVRKATLEFPSAKLRNKAAAMEPPSKDGKQVKVFLSEATWQEPVAGKAAPAAEPEGEDEAPVERPKKKVKKSAKTAAK